MPWNNTVFATTPGFIADPNSVVYNTGRQIDWPAIPEAYLAGESYTITLNDAAAAEDDTEITVVALPVALPIGTVLDFGVHSVDGAQMLAKLAAPAAAGDTTLTTEPLGHGIEDEATAAYVMSSSHKKVIPAGTVMVQIAASGKIVPRAVRPGSENAAMLLLSTATEDSRVDAKSGYGCLVGGVVYEDLLPEDISSYKTELATAGARFHYETYSDSRES